MRRTGFTLIELLVVLTIIVVLLMCAGAGGILEIPFRLLFGWIWYLIGVMPQMTVSWPAVGMAVLTLAALTAGLHVTLPRAIARFRDDGHTPAWRLRWTGAIVGVVVLMFVAGIALVGATHQVGWLMSSDERWFQGPDSARRVQSRNHLKLIGLAMHNHHDAKGRFPPGAIFDETGRALHSWQTALLPYIEQNALFDSIDHQRPWNDPVNKRPFSTVVRIYLNPGNPESDRPRMTPFGPSQPLLEYARSDYSANVRLYGERDGAVIRNISDGTSNTIMSGEITDELPAWGDPHNMRDPALGIGTSPRGFNGPWGSDDDTLAQFLFADGSVRSISGSVDADVMKALATPDNADVLPDDF